jgi:hypothetical protein
LTICENRRRELNPIGITANRSLLFSATRYKRGDRCFPERGDTMFTMVAALLLAWHGDESQRDPPPQLCEYAPQTWICYLPTLSNAPTDEPEMMEIVLRVRCESWNDKNLWRMGPSCGSSCDVDKQIRFASETQCLTYWDGGAAIYSFLARPPVMQFPTQSSTLRIARQSVPPEFAEEAMFPQTAPADLARPKTVTITNIEIKVNGAVHPANQVDIPIGTNQQLHLVPQPAEMSPEEVSPSMGRRDRRYYWGEIYYDGPRLYIF